MKFLVIGCGSIGERHICNLLSLSHGDILVLDKDRIRMERLVDKYGVSIYDSHSSPQIDAFLICVPTAYHIQYALEGLRHNSHLFIEKPLSHTMEGVDEALGLAEQKELVIAIGYQYRFHPAMNMAKKLIDEGKIGKVLSIKAEYGQWLLDWHPNEDYRKLYTAQEKMGGGVILDCSHEIDYVRWLAGSEVKEVSCFADKLSSMEIDVEDVAEINLRFDNGIIANVHLDFTQRTLSRSCKIIGEAGAIVWTFPDFKVRLLTQYGIKEIVAESTADMYVEEMKHFIDCIQGKDMPIVDGITGKSVLQIALAAKKSSLQNRVIIIGNL